MGTRCSPSYKKRNSHPEPVLWTDPDVCSVVVRIPFAIKKAETYILFYFFSSPYIAGISPGNRYKKRNKTFTYCFKLRRIYHIFVHLSIVLQNFVNFPLYFSHYSQSIRYSQRIKYDTLFIVLIRRLDSTTWYHTNHSLKLCFVRT